MSEINKLHISECMSALQTLSKDMCSLYLIFSECFGESPDNVTGSDIWNSDT